MPGYVNKAILRFRHQWPQWPQNSPHKHVPPTFGAKSQYTQAEIFSLLLNKADKTYVQAVTGTFLYYERAVDLTILVVLNAIATEQANPMQLTKDKVTQLLDYCTSQEEVIITYRASDMILAVHSDAGYLNKCKSRSRAGGIFTYHPMTCIPQLMGLFSTLQK